MFAFGFWLFKFWLASPGNFCSPIVVNSLGFSNILLSIILWFLNHLQLENILRYNIVDNVVLPLMRKKITYFMNYHITNPPLIMKSLFTSFAFLKINLLFQFCPHQLFTHEDFNLICSITEFYINDLVYILFSLILC